MNLDGLTEKRRGKMCRWFEDYNGNIVSKICKGCGLVKSVKEFTRCKKGLGGYKSKCKICRNDIEALYRSNNREKCSQKVKRWQEKNKEKVSAYRKTYKLSPEQVKNKRTKARDYYYENREKVLSYHKNYAKVNRDKIVSRRARYYEINKEVLREKTAEWKRHNKTKVRIQYHRRRAAKLKLPHDITIGQKEEILNYFEHKCCLTGSLDINFDHVIPLATGHGGTTFNNMIPLRSDLNNSKNASNIFEWFEANRQRFNLEQSLFDRLIEWLGKANGMTVEEYRDYVYWCHANPRCIDELKAQ